jgi:hypothetical protein
MLGKAIQGELFVGVGSRFALLQGSDIGESPSLLYVPITRVFGAYGDPSSAFFRYIIYDQFLIPSVLELRAFAEFSMIVICLFCM